MTKSICQRCKGTLKCEVCGGSGKILDFKHEDMADVVTPLLKKCTDCKGNGLCQDCKTNSPPVKDRPQHSPGPPPLGSRAGCWLAWGQSGTEAK